MYQRLRTNISVYLRGDSGVGPCAAPDCGAPDCAAASEEASEARRAAIFAAVRVFMSSLLAGGVAAILSFFFWRLLALTADDFEVHENRTNSVSNSDDRRPQLPHD